MSLFHKAVVVECSSGTEDLAKEIEKKTEEMLKKRLSADYHVDGRNNPGNPGV